MFKNRYKVLFVDDDKFSTLLFKETLEEYYDIYTALSAQEGISILESNRIDIIFSDEKMPEMTGTDFLHFASLHFPHAVRILVSGGVTVEIMVNAINRARVEHYIQKPWNEIELIRVIEHTMKLNYLDHENFRKKKELTLNLVEAMKSEHIINAAIKAISDLDSHQKSEDIASILKVVKNKLSNYHHNKELWEIFKLQYLEVHGDFFQNLKNAHSSLSETELKYCAYLNMGMSQLQIANSLNVTISAVTKGLYRTKKKIGSFKQKSLKEYLATI